MHPSVSALPCCGRAEGSWGWGAWTRGSFAMDKPPVQTCHCLISLLLLVFRVFSRLLASPLCQKGSRSQHRVSITPRALLCFSRGVCGEHGILGGSRGNQAAGGAPAGLGVLPRPQCPTPAGQRKPFSTAEKDTICRLQEQLFISPEGLMSGYAFGSK